MRTSLNDGRHYDAAHAYLGDDLPFWTRRARAAGGPVLELACGTGRVALAIAEAGVEVVGVDRSAAYLEQARRKAEGRALPVAWVEADMRGFRLGRRFPLVIVPFRSVGVLLTDADVHACLARVAAHLLPGGEVIVDAYNGPPDAGVLAPREFAYEDPDGGGRIRVRQERRYDAATAVETVSLTLASDAGESSHDELRLRRWTADELCGALGAHGLAPTAHFGGYDERPHTADAPVQLIVATAPHHP